MIWKIHLQQRKSHAPRRFPDANTHREHSNANHRARKSLPIRNNLESIRTHFFVPNFIDAFHFRFKLFVCLCVRFAYFAVRNKVATQIFHSVGRKRYVFRFFRVFCIYKFISCLTSIGMVRCSIYWRIHSPETHHEWFVWTRDDLWSFTRKTRSIDMSCSVPSIFIQSAVCPNFVYINGMSVRILNLIHAMCYF